MKKVSLITICSISALSLIGCQSTSTSVNTDALFDNPLFVERYAEEMVQGLVELKIQDDPILEDKGIAKIVDKERLEWMEKAKEARSQQRKGRNGHFITINKYISGEALYLNNMLYFGTLFETTPSPSLHVHLTTVVDPRDVEFPDETSIDLGEMQSTYGAQTYKVQKVENPLLYRTIVLWDKELKQMHGFMQLSQR